MARNRQDEVDEVLGRRRGQPRVAVNHEFRSLQEFITEYVADISASGVFIRTDDPLPVGTKVDLRFTVIDDEIETVEGVGVVARVVAPGTAQAAGMGVTFERLTPASQQVVARLTARAKRGA
ncbi:MAG: PilZ domain-containing protein [Myxococcota bacterium]